jgi:hypothetical protein
MRRRANIFLQARLALARFEVVSAEILTQFRSILACACTTVAVTSLSNSAGAERTTMHFILRSREEQLNEELRKLRLRPDRVSSVGHHNDLGPVSPDTGVLSCNIVSPRSSFSVTVFPTMAICLR